jgi:hypothetical protein
MRAEYPGYATYEIVQTELCVEADYIWRETRTIGGQTRTVVVRQEHASKCVDEAAFVSWADLRRQLDEEMNHQGENWVETIHVTVRATRSSGAVAPGLNFPRMPELAMNIASPYSPVMNPSHRYRLGRTFRIPSLPPNAETAPVPVPPSGYSKYSPSDLRIDGAHIDPHCAFGYTIQNHRISTQAAVAMWYKPNFFPESTPRMRTLASFADYNQVSKQSGYGLAALSYPLPFNLHFLPSYHTFEEPTMPVYGEPSRAATFVWAIGADRAAVGSSSAGGIGYISPTLNHEFEPAFSPSSNDDWNRFTGQQDGKANLLRHHEWHHIVIWCQSGTGWKQSSGTSWTGSGIQRTGIYLNGRSLNDAVGQQMMVHIDDSPSTYSTLHGDEFRIGGEFSYIGVRTTSGAAVDSSSSTSAPRLYYADGTVDEVYFFRDAAAGAPTPSAAINLFRSIGRYYRPSDVLDDDGIFVSAPLALAAKDRSLPPGSTVAPPPGGAGGSTSVAPPAAGSRGVQILAVSWTALAEDYDRDDATDPGGVPRMRSFMRDHQPTINGQLHARIPPTPRTDPNGCDFPTVALVSIVVEGPGGTRMYGPYQNEGWSPVRTGHRSGSATTEHGAPVSLSPGETARYRVKLRVGALPAGGLLLATPVLDDVTIFYRKGPVEIVQYVEHSSQD